jgi:Zn-dependent M28 family amino/carboxypeptidase
MSFRLLILTVILSLLSACKESNNPQFNGNNALEFAQTQMDFGPRTPGSTAHQQTVDWIQSKLREFNWETEIQSEQIPVTLIQNIIGKREGSDDSWIVIAAHYDSRLIADQDGDSLKKQLPVPGANDGASGVAVLLELARVLPQSLDKNIWLVFFDAEDQGRIDNWDWILGSTSLADHLENQPDQLILLDMIGDEDLNIYYEKNSDVQLREEIWQIAAQLGYGENFIPQEKFSMLDDHIPFAKKGVKVVDLIDFDYPYWHTSQDTMDKISADSLEIIGNTIFQWLLIP